MSMHLSVMHSVFLSHSGFQKAFTERLCLQLESIGYVPFFDIRHHSLPKCERFLPRLLDAAQKCQLAVVVLSEEYVCSPWPMRELSIFVERSKQHGSELKILPLFFELSLKDLVHKENLSKWRTRWEDLADEGVDVEKFGEALKELSSWDGLEFKGKNLGEADYLKDIISSICQSVLPLLTSYTSDIVGKNRLCKELIRSFDEFESSDSRAVYVLGVYGIPGTGKTVLSRCLVDHFHPTYLGKSFYVDLSSAHGVVQELKEILQKLTPGIGDVASFVSLTDERKVLKLIVREFQCNEVFLVFDHIPGDSKAQDVLIEILKNGFLGGSRVVILSRTQHTLQGLLKTSASHVRFKVIAVPFIDEGEAVRILSNAAGLTCHDEQEQNDIVRAARCFQLVTANGERCYHPLAMKIVGDLMRRTEETWWSMKLDEFSSRVLLFREQTVKEILQLSYGELEDHLQLLFLDVAAFIEVQSKLPVTVESEVVEYFA